MSTAPRRAVLCLLAGVVSLVTAGCGLLSPGVDDAQRDASSGAITEAADADVFQLQVGDCLADDTNTDEAQEVFSVPTIPCAEPHGAEVFLTKDLPDGDYPGDEAVFTQADELCYAEFEAFVGTTYEESVLDFSYYSPTQESWGAGDREVACVVVDPEGGVVGSMKDAGR